MLSPGHDINYHNHELKIAVFTYTRPIQDQISQNSGIRGSQD